jgi:peroxiredoxin family protein
MHQVYNLKPNMAKIEQLNHCKKNVIACGQSMTLFQTKENKFDK